MARRIRPPSPLRVRAGERLRVRLINASAEHTHVIRLAGHRLSVTHTDGNPLVRPVEVDTLPIAPSERYDVLVTAGQPGAWFLYCAAPGHAAAGEQALVVYEGREGVKPEAPAEGVFGLSAWQYGLGRGRAVLPRPSCQERSFDLTLGGGMMGSEVWTINGKQYDDRNLVHLALMLLSSVQFGQLKSRTIQSCLGNCTDFQSIIATLATSQLGKER